ncbi:MAG: hypothetical protein C5B52_02835 [Bacteroidetes bacterium]|nr:MAG: hypothetical protein C5B52_02835 [Bacteroidota bacterium]
MKLILVLATLFMFASCSKEPLIDFRLPPIRYTWDFPDYSYDVRSSQFEASIYSNTDTFFYFSTSFTNSFARTITDSVNNIGVVSISTFEGIKKVDISMNMNLEPGTYSFGNDVSNGREISAKYILDTTTYSSNTDFLNGLIKIDTLTAKKIQGTFNVTCFNGSDSVVIKNGKFFAEF